MGSHKSNVATSIHTDSRGKRQTKDRVPTGTGKPGKMKQLFPVIEKSGNFEKM